MSETYERVQDIEIDLRSPVAASRVSIDGTDLPVTYAKIEAVPGDVYLKAELHVMLQRPGREKGHNRGTIHKMTGKLLVEKENYVDYEEEIGKALED